MSFRLDPKLGEQYVHSADEWSQLVANEFEVIE